MYNKILKKYTIFKIFTLSLPRKIGSNTACYYLTKYFIKTTPYGNINLFIKEVYKLTSILYNPSFKKDLFFICTNKIFFYDLNKAQGNLTFLFWKNINVFSLNYNIKTTCIALWYNLSYSNKIIGYLKNKKILSVGFIDNHNQPNTTDYTILLNAKSFSSIFIFHFILKKIILFNVTN